ncbi:hypothetical protein O7632_20210 [Solwaraspora sp. WMMD406]|uniref:hypothetical protein n=1 Tax=Solwaraspora sp. WMMD406 TaxID=3016095 RepID=UPI002415A565|nr:hypothetical protein [Solwaraspora sp. WMMD406]MDG4766404.1 hypothetical protein [Solwaraspora sp. WMMD406]
MTADPLRLDAAVDLTRTGDLWLFRGRSVPDRAIQLTTNSPVNHVGMAVVIDDLPPLLWHAELGRSLPDMWSGTHHRGVQLHDLRDAVTVWARRYGQRGWLRQLDPPADARMEDAVLRTIARLDGTPFPSTAQLAWRWLRGRTPSRSRTARLPGLPDLPGLRNLTAMAGLRSVRRAPDRPGGWPTGRRASEHGADRSDQDVRAAGLVGTGLGADLESVYCAEVVALTYEAMGLLPTGRRTNWYDPGRFWSGDDLRLRGGARLGAEIAVQVSPEDSAGRRGSPPDRSG